MLVQESDPGIRVIRRKPGQRGGDRANINEQVHCCTDPTAGQHVLGPTEILL